MKRFLKAIDCTQLLEVRENVVGFEKALGAVKVIKDRIQYRSDQSLLNLARSYFTYVNEEVCKGKIVFEPDSDPNQLVFQDTRVNLRGGFLRLVIYSKPTDAHRYLDPASCHPTQVPGAIPLSVGLRVGRN